MQTEWIKSSKKLPNENEKIEMTCKQWELNWNGNFQEIYLEKGSFSNGVFWDEEGPRIDNPTYWRSLPD